MALTFSVITPSYCQGRFIRRTIDSVLAQQEKGIILDYLVCDGGSDDETLSILREYYGQIRWLSEPDDGQADAVNKGISMTQGEIIAWINSDDVYYPGALAKVKQVFDQYPKIQAIYGDADHIDEFDHVLEPYPTEPWNFDRLKNVCFLCQPATFFRRSIVDQFGFLDAQLQYCMDYELWLRYGEHLTFYYLSKKLAGSRLYNSNKTLGQRLQVHREINDMLKRKFGRVPDKWVFNYAQIRLEESSTVRNDPLPENPGLNLDFINRLVLSSLQCFIRWNRFVSPSAAAQMFRWLGSAYVNWFKYKFAKLRARIVS